MAIDPVIESGRPDPSVESVVDAKRGTQPRRSASVVVMVRLPFRLLGMFQVCLVYVAGGTLMKATVRADSLRAGVTPVTAQQDRG